MTNQEAIEALERLKHCMEYTPPKELEAINIAIAALETPRDWTPCAEGLPAPDDIYDLDNRKQYWCTVTQRIGEEIVSTYGATMEYVQYKCKQAFWMYYGSRESLSSNEAVIAWQPLPEPYNPDHIRDTTKKVQEADE